MYKKSTIMAFVLGMISFLCCAAEEKEKKTEAPKDAPAEIGKWEGFRGVKWGTSGAEIPGLYEHEKSEYIKNYEKAFDSYSYSRNEEPVNVGGVIVKNVHYNFTNNRLVSVNMSSEGKANLALLTKYLFATYGTAFDSATTSHRWGEFDSNDYGARVELMHIDTNNDSITLSFSCCSACEKDGFRSIDCTHGTARDDQPPPAPIIDSDAEATDQKSLNEMRVRACSDDAASIDEVFSHGEARALIIRSISPNKLNVGGREFRVKQNPLGDGCFVYDSRTLFHGVERLIVWWVNKDGKGYALNSPSKMVTPDLKFPMDDGLSGPDTGRVVNYVFKGIPMQ